jgi:hypothetical protein
MMNEMLAKCGLTWTPGCRGILIFVMSLGLAVCPLTLPAQSVTLAWNPSPSANVAGYMLYYGADGINFDNQMDAGTNTSATVTDLEPGSTNYFEVVAYDANNDQSPPSNQIEYTVPNAAQTVTVLANPTNAGGVTGSGAFAAGSSVTVTATANGGYTFANWTENGTVQTNSPNYSFTLTSNCNLVANFTANPVAVANSSQTTVTNSGQTTATNSGQTTVTNSSQTTTTNSSQTTATNSGQTTVTNSVVGTTSVTNSVTNANTKFTLLTNGNGTLAPNPNGKAFQTGKKYTLTATAAKGSVFSNWVSNGIVVAATPKYTFLAKSNVVLQANFVPNPFIPVAGTYYGLFYVSGDAAEESSGSVVATVTSAGAFSAKLRLGTGSYSYSGELSLTGAAIKSIPRSGLSPITVQLQLGLTNGPLSGTISDGTWTADLVADAAVYSKANPAPQAGKYTLLIPGSENASTQPGGNGFGAVTVSASGNVTFSGILGDGTAVTSTSIVSSEGQWPFYVSLYGGKGSILGWLTFTNEGVISGQTGWFKLPQATAKLYPGGFTNSAGAMGSVYQYTNGLPVLGFSEGQLSLTNGNLAQSITNQIGLGPDMQASDQSADKLTFKTSSGLFKGSVTNPETGKLITVNGIVLQNQNFGAGYFLGTTESGSVLLSPTQ